MKPNVGTKSGVFPIFDFDNKLFERAVQLSNVVYTGHKVIKILDSGDNKKIILRNLKKSEEKEIPINTIITTDGVNSTIVRLTGLLKKEKLILLAGFGKIYNMVFKHGQLV